MTSVFITIIMLSLLASVIILSHYPREKYVGNLSGMATEHAKVVAATLKIAQEACPKLYKATSSVVDKYFVPSTMFHEDPIGHGGRVKVAVHQDNLANAWSKKPCNSMNCSAAAKEEVIYHIKENQGRASLQRGSQGTRRNLDELGSTMLMLKKMDDAYSKAGLQK
jgi:hypothetical protein